jgi:nicotinate-nucleotide adenylyltransferase
LPTSRPPEPAGTAERIGLFGGTFDPPHLGHVAALRAVSSALSLDRLLLVVANDPWQKSSSRAVTPAEDRFAMAQALAEGIPGVEASRMEIDRGGPSFTVTTVEALRAEALAVGRPMPQIYLIVGADGHLGGRLASAHHNRNRDRHRHRHHGPDRDRPSP